MHFHLAASINAETGKDLQFNKKTTCSFNFIFLIFIIQHNFIDIPLVPSLITGDPDREPNFILHWLNNKEMQFTMQAENILQVSYIHWNQIF